MYGAVWEHQGASRGVGSVRDVLGLVETLGTQGPEGV